MSSSRPDVAMGVGVVLVVLGDVVEKHYLAVTWRMSAPFPGGWGKLGALLLPLGTAVFFTVSGAFAADAVHRPWSVVGRSQVARFLYLFLLWFAIDTVVLSFTPDFDAGRPWFQYALALYFVVAKLTRHAPPALVLGAAFLLATASTTGLLAAPGDGLPLYQNLFFYLVGLRAGAVSGSSGPRGLAVYVLHRPVLALLDHLLFGPLCTAGARAQWVLALTEPAVLTGVIVAICGLLVASLRRLFDLPGRRKRDRRTVAGAA